MNEKLVSLSLKNYLFILIGLNHVGAVKDADLAAYEMR